MTTWFIPPWGHMAIHSQFDTCDYLQLSAPMKDLGNAEGWLGECRHSTQHKGGREKPFFIACTAHCYSYCTNVCSRSQVKGVQAVLRGVTWQDLYVLIGNWWNRRMQYMRPERGVNNWYVGVSITWAVKWIRDWVRRWDLLLGMINIQSRQLLI